MGQRVFENGAMPSQPDENTTNETRVIPAEMLFGQGCNEVLIDHYGQQYQLRITRNGKLILTK